MATDRDNLVDDREKAALVNIRLAPEQADWVRVDEETGVLDLPISVVRELAAWLRRYDTRPKVAAKPGRYTQ